MNISMLTDQITFRTHITISRLLYICLEYHLLCFHGGCGFTGIVSHGNGYSVIALRYPHRIEKRLAAGTKITPECIISAAIGSANS
jgi:hypothetical protein